MLMKKTSRPGKRHLGRGLRWCSFCLLLVGACALTISGFTWTYARLYQVYQSWQFDQVTREALSEGRAGLSVHLNEDDEPVRASVRRLDAGGSSTEPPHRSIIGRIQIPRINLSVMIGRGVDDNTLRVAVGHIPGTALPGQTGNVGIAGHRDTFFRGLRDIHLNDVITLGTLAGAYQYQVESIQIVEPHMTDVLNTTAQPTLTLVTCYPFSFVGPAPKRFIVRARQVATPEDHMVWHSTD